MKWSDFSPYVLPYVTGCPQPVMDQHVKLAAIDFFRRTLSYRQVLEPVVTEGTALVPLEAPMDTQIIKIKSVTVGDSDFPLVETSHGLELSRTNPGREFAFTQDGRTLVVYPIQPAGIEVIAEVAVAPSITSNTLDDALAQQHMQDIAHGAVASIKRIPGQPFSDLAGSPVHQAMFEARVSTVAAKHSRGVMAAKMRSFPKFL